jgi:hypothetical protein
MVPLPNCCDHWWQVHLDPAQKTSTTTGRRLEYSAADEAGAMPTIQKRVEPLEIVHPNAAGLDIGARAISACVPPDRAGETIKVFGTFTPDLDPLADWFVVHQEDTVVMASTGIYWIPVFERLEARGLKLSLARKPTAFRGGLRTLGSPRLEAVPGPWSPRQASAPTHIRHAKRSVTPEVACAWIAHRIISTRWRAVCPAGLSPSSGRSCAISSGAWATHAESSAADEPALTPGGVQTRLARTISVNVRQQGRSLSRSPLHTRLPARCITC